MNDSWLRRIACLTALVAIAILIASVVMLLLAPDIPTNYFGWGNILSSIVAFGAPILGVIIVIRQPHNRIGWLFITYGLMIGFRSLGHGIYYFHDSQPTGYSALEYFFLWSTESANLIVFACLILLLLWFPDGQLPSNRWHWLYLWFFPAFALLFMSNFMPGPDWNGGADAGGIVVDNPYGWLSINPTNPIYYLGFPSFISLILITILSAISLIFRYRSADQLVRTQIGWFVLGGFFSIILFFLPVIDVFSGNQNVGGIDNLLTFIGQMYIIPIYVAVGVAILRYRLYDIDLIIRRTIQYTLLTGLLAVIYFGCVVLLQSLVENLTGEQSPIVIVFSTLAIAALVGPLRVRVQDFIDRRFYRKKYDAEQTLTQFANVARDEVDMDKLAVALLDAVEETMQPDKVSLWLSSPKPDANRR